MRAKPVRSNAHHPVRKRFSAEERRDQLLRVAAGLFSDHGFENTTTKSIAAAAGVSEGIIFQHFVTKEELYSGILNYKAKEAGFQKWNDQMRECVRREDDEGLVLSLVKQILEANRRDPQFQRLMFQAALNGHQLPKMMVRRILPLHRFLCKYIARRQKQGVFQKCDAGLAVHALVSMPSYYGLAKTMFGIDELKLSEDQMAISFTRIILEGLRAPCKVSRKKGTQNAK